MNWDKMINSLIIIFLSINIGLFFFNSYKANEQYNISSERKEQLISILKDNNIELGCELPSNYPKSKVQLQTPIVNKKDILDTFFGEEHRLISVTNLYEKHYSNNREIYFYKGENKGVITYVGKEVSYKPSSNTENSIIEAGEKFASDITLNSVNLTLTSIKAYDKYYELEFNEKYKDNILFSNYVIVRMSEHGVLEARTIRYNPIKFLGAKQEIFPIDEVLYNYMINNNNEEKVKIIDIDLGYNLGVDEIGYNSVAEAVPYYRIKLDNGSTYYINAYTNLLIDL